MLAVRRKTTYLIAAISDTREHTYRNTFRVVRVDAQRHVPAIHKHAAKPGRWRSERALKCLIGQARWESSLDATFGNHSITILIMARR
jgi:hypothetical protein